MSAKSGDAKKCTYWENNRECRQPATHTVDYHRKEWAMCERHAAKKFHPPDVHNRIVELTNA